jgi:8-oxo-dGTP pyrophosphatase MutT (NUDIX family)
VSPPEEIRDALRRFRRRGVGRWGSSRAVVAITIVTGADGPAVLLTRRADSSRPHSGTFSLPGGRTDRWTSAPAAARRRLAEELGLRLPPESVLGLLDDYVTYTGLVITPVVLWAGEHVPATEIIAVTFADLDVEPVFVASSESDRPVIRLPLHGGWLHAPPAAVLHQFREVVFHRRRTRAGAL